MKTRFRYSFVSETPDQNDLLLKKVVAQLLINLLTVTYADCMVGERVIAINSLAEQFPCTMSCTLNKGK